MSVDFEGFESLMAQARETSRRIVSNKSTESDRDLTLTPGAIAILRHSNIEPTKDIDKYHGRPLGAKLLAIWNGEDFDNTAFVGRKVAIITNRTNFYAEQGGQVGDTGIILTDVKPAAIPMRGYRRQESGGGCTFRVDDTQVYGGYIIHIGQATDDELRVRDRVHLQVDKHHRGAVMANHTTTHLLNLALRQVLGDEVHQKGSLVAPDRLRFDFSHSGAMTPDELQHVEQRVNQAIDAAMRVHAEDVPLELALKIKGVRAVFGEVYPDPVRVVSIGEPIKTLVTDLDNETWLEHSIEFCGGIHLNSTDLARRFVIVQEGALAAGIRRIFALIGAEAEAACGAASDFESRLIQVSELEDQLFPDAVETIARQLETASISVTARHRLQSLLDDLLKRVREIRKKTQAAGQEKVVELARILAENEEGPVIVHQVEGADKDSLLVAMDVVRAKRPEAAAMLFAACEVESKVAIVAGVPQGLIDKGLKAGDWVRQAAQICGGGGGGKPDLAQAGGKNPEKVNEAIIKAREFAEQAIS